MNRLLCLQLVVAGTLLAQHSFTQVDIEDGGRLFRANCAVCHGEAGKGNQDMGAPNLTDKIWLYGSDEATIVEDITNGRGSVMPAWSGRLDPVTIKSLAVYVHSLGGGL